MIAYERWLDFEVDCFVEDYDIMHQLFIVGGDYPEAWWGLMNLNCEIVFQCSTEVPIWEDRVISTDGVLTYYDDRIRAYRYFDIMRGSFIGDEYTLASPFVNGFAAVKDETGQMFIIDKSGEQVSPAYQQITCLQDPNEPATDRYLYAAYDDAQWYIYNLQENSTPIGKFTVPISSLLDEPPRYIGCGILLWLYDGGTALYSVRNEEWLILEDIWEIYDFTGEVATMIKGSNGKVGFLFSNFSILPCIYDDASSFLGEYVFVKSNEEWHAIASDSHIVEPCYAISADLFGSIKYVWCEMVSSEQKYFEVWCENGVYYLDEQLHTLSVDMW